MRLESPSYFSIFLSLVFFVFLFSSFSSSPFLVSLFVAARSPFYFAIARSLTPEIRLRYSKCFWETAQRNEVISNKRARRENPRAVSNTKNIHSISVWKLARLNLFHSSFFLNFLSESVNQWQCRFSSNRNFDVSFDQLNVDRSKRAISFKSRNRSSLSLPKEKERERERES